MDECKGEWNYMKDDFQKKQDVPQPTRSLIPCYVFKIGQFLYSVSICLFLFVILLFFFLCLSVF